MNGKDAESLGAQNRIGLNGGLTLNLPFSDLISIQPEVLYSMKGYRYDLNTAKGDITHHYVDIPLLLRIDADGPFFEFGPQLGLLVKAVHAPDGAPSFERPEYNKTDIGYIAGVGYQLENGFSLGLRYNGGISNLINSGSNQAHRNSAFMLQLGYRFGAN